jgi:uncharacterized paraquat-inducible protein A
MHSIQQLSSESDMEIEFGNDDCGDDISDGDAVCLCCTGLLSHDKNGEKWPQCVRCYIVGRMKTVGLRKTNLCAPCA